jgi:hypothetical protein
MRRTARALPAVLAAGAVLALTGPAGYAGTAAPPDPVASAADRGGTGAGRGLGTAMVSASCEPSTGAVPGPLGATPPALADGPAHPSRVGADRATVAARPGAAVRIAAGEQAVTGPARAQCDDTSAAAGCEDGTLCAESGRCGQGEPCEEGGVSGLDAAGGDSAGRDAAGQDGAGRDGAGQDGQEGGGPDGAAPEGSGQDSGGRDGSGWDGAGQDGSGRDGSGHESSGHDGDGHDGGGQDSGGQDGGGQDGGGHDDHGCADSGGASCPDGHAAVQHGVAAGQGGTFDDSVPALAAGGALIAAACAGAGYRVHGRVRPAAGRSTEG